MHVDEYRDALGGFTARYPGQCENCDEEIRPGETIKTIRTSRGTRGYRHAVCPEQTVLVKRPVCGSCFQEVAVNGKCGCSE